METEEKYSQILKEKELLKEKERIFVETCDALTRLNNITNQNGDARRSETVIDITGEEDRGGSTSNVLSCNKCGYKTSQARNLSEHNKSEHEVSLIPCDLCDYVGKSTTDYSNHVGDKHGEQNETANNNVHKNNTCGKEKEKDKKEKNDNNEAKKKKQNNVEIPCDLCNFKSKSADDFIKHIESKHQNKADTSTEKPCYECGRCDYKGTSEDHFKKHLETAHKLNVVGRRPSNENKSRKLCINWNRGHCPIILNADLSTKTFQLVCSKKGVQDQTVNLGMRL